MSDEPRVFGGYLCVFCGEPVGVDQAFAVVIATPEVEGERGAEEFYAHPSCLKDKIDDQFLIPGMFHPLIAAWFGIEPDVDDVEQIDD
jgi:hypothetical protein